MDAPPVHYVTTSDGCKIAYTVCGEGRPLICTPFGGFNHVQLNWQRGYSPWLQGLSERFRLIHFDGRGQGLSTRGLPESASMADWGRDLEAVADGLQLDRFVILGCFLWSHVAVRYAVDHPERVDALVSLYAGPVGAFGVSLAAGDYSGAWAHVALAAEGGSPVGPEMVEKIRKGLGG